MEGVPSLLKRSVRRRVNLKQKKRTRKQRKNRENKDKKIMY